MIDHDQGPNAFKSISLPNHYLPEKADKEVADALRLGGFGADNINRRIGNYEGQIMAIRRGFVDKQRYGWLINNAGRVWMSARGTPAPVFLKARDDWHSRDHREHIFDLCVWEVERSGKPFLKFAKELYPVIGVGMDPLFGREHAKALRDLIDDWLNRTG